MKNDCEAGKCGEFLRNLLVLDPETLKARLPLSRNRTALRSEDRKANSYRHFHQGRYDIFSL